MAAAEEREKFTWKSQGDTPPFPLDYSANELEDYWKIHRSFITDYIISFPSFQNFFLKMRYTKGIMREGETYERKGIPAELEPFFRIYIDEATKKQWHFLKNKESRSPVIDKENLADFEKFFCDKLYNMALDAEHNLKLNQEVKQQSDEKQSPQERITESETPAEESRNLYWYRRLFDNQAFQRHISLQYWEKEYNYRCDLVRDLSLQLPYEAQIQQLQKAILYMDAQIAAMLYIIERDHAQEKQNNRQKEKGFFGTYPTELIDELREPVIDSKVENKRVGYRVDNIEITAVIDGTQKTNKLSAFFDDIKANKNARKTRKAIRPYYLNTVCKVPKKPEFQAACEALQFYLASYANIQKQDEDLRNYVIRRCKMYYQNFFRFMEPCTGALQPGADSSAGAYMVIDELISSMYSTFCFQHNHEIMFVNEYNRDLQNHIIRGKKQAEESIEAGLPVEYVYKICSEWYLSMVKSLCSGYLVKEPEILDQELPPEQIDQISHEMEIGCQDAYAAFGGRAYNWMNEIYFKKLWNRYNALCSTFNITIDPAGTCEEDVQLCTALLMYRVWKECVATENAAIGSFNALRKYLMQKKGGSHSTTHQKI